MLRPDVVHGRFGQLRYSPNVTQPATRETAKPIRNRNHCCEPTPRDFSAESVSVLDADGNYGVGVSPLLIIEGNDYQTHLPFCGAKEFFASAVTDSFCRSLFGMEANSPYCRIYNTPSEFVNTDEFY
jgi:hypothetical protein